MNNYNKTVLGKILTAVESGGQKYGQGDWGNVTLPYTNSSKEHTVTLGAYQFGGGSNEGRDLLKLILADYPNIFKSYDNCGLEKTLTIDWYGTHFKPTDNQIIAIRKIISTEQGVLAQTKMYAEVQLPKYLKRAKEYGIPESNVYATMMWVEIEHLGGLNPTKRVFNRCDGIYMLDSIMTALKLDQFIAEYRTNGVGSVKYWSRHVACRKFIEQYAQEEDKVTSALSRAKTLLRQPQNDTMTGFTPDGAGYFKKANQYYTTPKKGDIIYFYSESKGRIGHTGIVTSADLVNKLVYTVEGNTSSTEYAENGGCVARHVYSFAKIGGVNRVNGFGRPNFAAAGVTADQFVETALSYLGYLEKRSNSNLDSKTANAGSNNYQRFQRDVGAGNGDQWCQYYVDAMALYTCQSYFAKPSIAQSNDACHVNVAKGQEWLNNNFGGIIKQYCGALLVVDGEFGPKSRNATLAVWKYSMNHLVDSTLTPNNTNFGDSCKKYASYATVGYGTSGTFTYLCQLLLAANGWYTDTMDGEAGNNTVNAIKLYQKSVELEVDGWCGPDTWFSLFNGVFVV